MNAQIKATGIEIETGVYISGINKDADGNVVSVSIADSPSEDAEIRTLPADMVVFGAGIRPNDELAREADLALGERGGILVNDACHSSDEHIWAIGEVACVLGRTWGLVAPANAMADAVAANLLNDNEEAQVEEFDIATKLKFSGVQVAGFGDRRGTTEGCLEVLFADPARGMYQKIVTSGDAKTLLGGVFVGDTAPFDSLKPLLGRELPAEPNVYLTAAGGGDGIPDTELPDDAILCSCNNISFGAVREAIVDGNHDVASLKSCTTAGTQCGSCVPMLQKTLEQQMKKMGLTVSKALCEHFDFSRAELAEAVASLTKPGTTLTPFWHASAAVATAVQSVSRPLRRFSPPSATPTSWTQAAVVFRRPTTAHWRTCRRTVPTPSFRVFLQVRFPLRSWASSQRSLKSSVCT